MSNANGIKDASTTLAGLLEEEIDIKGINVVLSSPVEISNVGSPTVSFFLYDVTENPHESTLRPEEVDVDTIRQGPLEVDLHYLLTAYPSGTGDTSRKTERQHVLLGEAMRVLRDDAVLRGSSLQGALEHELRVTRGDNDDAIMDVWNTFPDTPYLPSISYTVGPVSIGVGEPEDADRVETLTRRGDDA